MIRIVRIHGNWCGPDWTGGQRVSAQDYTGSWDYPCQDRLDCACRDHDRSCSGAKGCSARADRKLARIASQEAAFPNMILRPIYAKKAEHIAMVMRLAALTRRH